MTTEIDIISQVGAIHRVVRDVERDGKAARTVAASRTYDTTVEDLWDAVTTAERISRWLAPVSGDLRLGGRYQIEGNAGGEVLTCDAPHHLEVTWEFGGDVSWLVVRLSADPAGAKLELEHTAIPNEHWDQFGPGAVGIGWDLSLLGLSIHLATGGGGMSPEEAAAWSASPDGVDFMRRSNDGWCDADVAGGAAPDEARAAADRTFAAYTGAEPAH